MAAKSSWRIILLGLGFLFAGSYLDNLRGILLPVFSTVFSLNNAENSTFLVVGNFAAVLFNLSLLELTHRYRDRSVAIGLAFFGMVAIAFSMAVNGFSSLIVLSVVLAGTISFFGSFANLLVIHGSTLRDRAKAMCGLHMMYGLGSVFAPPIAGALLVRGHSWQSSLWIIFPMCLALLVGSARSLHRFETEAAVKGPRRLNGLQVFIVVIFSIYVAGEVLMSMWMASYLVDSQKLTIAQAAPYLSGFFMMMAVTRLLCFLFLKPDRETFVLIASLVLSIGFFCLGLSGVYWGFSLAGILGPFFPVFLARVGRVFSVQARPLTLWILAGNQLILIPFHLLLGLLADWVGIRMAYHLPVPLLVGCLSAFIWYLRLELSYARVAE